jgi:outer membrane receptor protein involved in Fe transport
MRSLFLFLLLFPVLLKAQFKGVVVDTQGKGLSGAIVVASLKSNPTEQRSVLTDSVGRFRFDQMSTDSLRIQVSYLGYSHLDTILAGRPLTAPILVMVQDARSLEGVTVTATKPVFQVLPDRMVFNVAQSITAAGSTAFELLQKSPGVLVDPNDNVSMNGKSGVRVYIDGRPSPLSIQEITAYLRSIPATEVQSIEIITKPSAQFEAAGNAGIINIKLKKNKSFGTNATLTAGWAIGLYPKLNGGVSLNHRERKYLVFASYSVQDYKNESTMSLYRFQNDSIFDQRSKTIIEGRSHTLKVGADYFISAKQTVGVLVNGLSSKTDGLTQSYTPISAQGNPKVDQALRAETVSDRQRTNLSVNLNYRNADTSGKVFQADIDFSEFDMSARANTKNVYQNPGTGQTWGNAFSSSTPVHIQFWVGELGWEKPWKGGKWQAGLRSSFARTQNKFDFYNEINGLPVLNQDRSNQFDYKEQIHAGYIQYGREKGKWGYRGGMRIEQTISDGNLVALNPVDNQQVKRQYINAFPTAGITYQVHRDHQIGLSYSRRIDRPSYQDLNPFENQLDDLTYSKGNPFLKPQFTDNIELRHSYKYKLNTTLSFSNVQDFFASITDTIEGRKNFITQQNIAQQKVWSLNSSIGFTLTKWWSGYASVGVSHNRYRADFEPGKEIRINNTVANLYLQHSFQLNKRLSMELSSFYMSPYVWGGTYECEPIWNIDLGMQYKFWKDQASLKLTVTDIFQQMPWAGVSRLGILQINASGAWESRQLRLQFSYRFGNKQVKSAQTRNTGINELKERVQ